MTDYLADLAAVLEEAITSDAPARPARACGARRCAEQGLPVEDPEPEVGTTRSMGPITPFKRALAVCSRLPGAGRALACARTAPSSPPSGDRLIWLQARVDAVVLAALSYSHLVYRPGVPHVAPTIQAGRVTFQAS